MPENSKFSSKRNERSKNKACSSRNLKKNLKKDPEVDPLLSEDVLRIMLSTD